MHHAHATAGWRTLDASWQVNMRTQAAAAQNAMLRIGAAAPILKTGAPGYQECGARLPPVALAQRRVSSR